MPFQRKLEKIADEVMVDDADATPQMVRRAVGRFCRSMGQIPEKRIRGALMALTAQIGCPECTRVQDLRHLFTSRAQERGMNPLLVQEMLSHTTLNMTRKYTHLGLDARREALEKLTTGDVDALMQ